MDQTKFKRFENDEMEKCATIYRRNSKNKIAAFVYVCYHCGLTFDTIDCTLEHIETHFQYDEVTIDEKDIKQECIDDTDIEPQPEMIYMKTVIKREEDYDLPDIVDLDSVDPMETTHELHLNIGYTSTPEAVKYVANEDVPRKSRTETKYLLAYNTFRKWQMLKKAPDISETVLMTYLHELAQKYKPTSLWAIYSMLKSTIQTKDNIDIGKYRDIVSFLKSKSIGYKPLKARVFTEREIQKFIDEAPDIDWLHVKVVCIFGVCGGCRSHELPRIKLEDMENYGDLLLVRIQETRSKGVRSFTITGEFYTVVQKYVALRPANMKATTTRFFLNYQRGKCTTQVIGKNKFGQMPRQIAQYLALPEPESYTGHSFRSTSAALLANRPNMETIVRHEVNLEEEGDEEDEEQEEIIFEDSFRYNIKNERVA